MVEPKITEPIPNLYRVPIRVPSPLQFIYAHVLITSGGILVTDVGAGEPAKASWRDAERQLGLRRGRVQAIWITHCHADHVGLAAWAAARWKAPVAMLPGEIQLAQSWYRKPLDLDPWHALYSRHGLPVDLIQAMLDSFREVARGVDLPSEIEALVPGPAPFRSPRLQVLHQGGHTDDHAVLHLPGPRVAICGDQLLARITPNIGYVPHHQANPLGAYFDALAELDAMRLTLALPSHEGEVRDVALRIAAIRQHHHERLQKILQQIDRYPTAYALTRHLFDRPLSPYQMRFAIGETLAHLEYLRLAGYLVAKEQAGRIHYRSTAP